MTPAVGVDFGKGLALQGVFVLLYLLGFFATYADKPNPNKAKALVPLRYFASLVNLTLVCISLWYTHKNDSIGFHRLFGRVIPLSAGPQHWMGAHGSMYVGMTAQSFILYFLIAGTHSTTTATYCCG